MLFLTLCTVDCSQIWLEDVNCTGTEGDVGDCAHAQWGESTCLHNEDVGLCCWGKNSLESGKRVGPSTFPRCPSVETSDLRMVDCNKEVCRLEIKHNDKWGTVCDNGFTMKSADRVCAILGYPGGGTFKQSCGTLGKYSGCAANSAGQGPIWLDDVVCGGYERDLEGCRHKPWGENKCKHEQDVGVCCKGERNGTIVPTECVGGELNYDFSKGFASSTGGPDLTPLFGGKLIEGQGFQFEDGQGLGVDPSGCIGSEVYTIYLKVKLEAIVGWKALVRSNGWGSTGLYINNHLMLAPEDSDVECEDKLKPNKVYQFLVKRTQDGTMTLYINGARCASGIPPVSTGNTYKLNPHNLILLSDNGMRNGKGDLLGVKIFNSALSDEDVSVIIACVCKIFLHACMYINVCTCL